MVCFAKILSLGLLVAVSVRAEDLTRSEWNTLFSAIESSLQQGTNYKAGFDTRPGMGSTAPKSGLGVKLGASNPTARAVPTLEDIYAALRRNPNLNALTIDQKRFLWSALQIQKKDTAVGLLRKAGLGVVIGAGAAALAAGEAQAASARAHSAADRENRSGSDVPETGDADEALEHVH